MFMCGVLLFFERVESNFIFYFEVHSDHGDVPAPPSSCRKLDLLYQAGCPGRTERV